MDSARPYPGTGITRWSRRHPLSTDILLAIVLAILTGADVAHHGSARAIALQTLLWLPVAFRRLAPVAAFVAVGLIAAIGWAVGDLLGGDVAVLLVLYTIAAHRARAFAIGGALAVEAGVILAVARFAGPQWPRFLLLLSVLVVAAAWLGISQQARRSHLAALVDRADRVEREAEQQAQLATAAERTRIAREMHDIVAHSLSVMVALADGAALTEEVDQARSVMRQVARTGREALADTRRVLSVLRTEADPAQRAPLPGLDALESLLAAVRSTGLNTSLSLSGTVFPVPEAAGIAIYRIVQEALTNTLKHAVDADQAVVRLIYRHPEIVLEVRDNGHVVATPDRMEGLAGGHGLLGVRERAALFGGTCEAGWGVNGGWHVTTTLRFPELTIPDGSAPNADAAALPAGGRA